MDEILVIKEIQAGNPDKFVDLYDFYIQKIYNFIFYKIGNKQDAQDITSEVFIKAFENINKFDLQKQTKFSSRIYTIAQNKVTDFFRENSKKINYPMIENITEKIDMLQNIDDKHKLKQVLDHLNTLDDTKKNIFVMRIRDNLSYEEISNIIGKSSSNCKTIFFRTLQEITSKFGVYGILLVLNLKNLP